MSQNRYLTADEIVDINRNVLKEIKVKKADSHRVASRQKIENALQKVQDEERDVHWKLLCS